MTLSGLAAGTTTITRLIRPSQGNHGHGGNKLNTGGFSLSGTIIDGGRQWSDSGAERCGERRDHSRQLGQLHFCRDCRWGLTGYPEAYGYAFTPGNQSTTVNGATFRVTSRHVADR